MNTGNACQHQPTYYYVNKNNVACAALPMGNVWVGEIPAMPPQACLHCLVNALSARAAALEAELARLSAEKATSC